MQLHHFLSQQHTMTDDTTGLTLPMSRIKKIVKLDPEHISSTETANYMLGIATELFVKQLTADAVEITKGRGKKKVMYTDMQQAVSRSEAYTFMRDLVPKKVPVGELVRKGIIRVRPVDEDKVNVAEGEQLDDTVEEDTATV